MSTASPARMKQGKSFSSSTISIFPTVTRAGRRESEVRIKHLINERHIPSAQAFVEKSGERECCFVRMTYAFSSLWCALGDGFVLFRKYGSFTAEHFQGTSSAILRTFESFSKSRSIRQSIAAERLPAKNIIAHKKIAPSFSSKNVPSQPLNVKPRLNVI